DARDVDAHVAGLGATDEKRTRAELDLAGLAERATRGDDEVHGALVSHDLPGGPKRPRTWPARGRDGRLRPMILADPTEGSERRQRRSEDPLVALHYQLSSSRVRG